MPGLRREEVALLAGVSVDYYTRLERGNAAGVSESVLEALARALQLDEAERAHLFDLARAAHVRRHARGAARAQQRVRPSVQRMLDAMTAAPAFVRNGRLDLLAANRLGHALYSQHFDSPHRPANTARFVFLDPRAPDFFVDWERVANDAVAILRTEAGRDPYDRDLSDLVGELSTRSETFRTRWAAHNVRMPRHRRQALPPPASSATSAHLRDDGARRRPRPDAVRLHRRARLEVGGGAEPPRAAGRRRPTEPDKEIHRCRSRGTASTPSGGRVTGSPAPSTSTPRGAVGRLARLSASSVHFTPGARTAWHTHPNGQTICVLEGVGLAQRHGGPVEVIRPGDRVFFEPGEEHWHGAAATRFMAHVAMLEVDEQGNTATWGDHVTDEEYGAAPPIE